MSTLLPYDPQTALIGVRDAAELAFGATTDPGRQRRNETRIRVWRHRGHLVPTKVDSTGHPVFLAIDVLRAVQKTKSSNPTVPLEERQRWGLPVRPVA